MGKLTMVFGVLLVLVGAGAFATLGRHPHTLIPAAFGLVLVVLGALANSADVKRRMLFMHIFFFFGMVCFVF